MKHRIVVLGAGYAGTHAAGRLARRLHPGGTGITVVNADPDFVERLRLHQLATGQELPARPLAGVFAGTAVDVRTERITAVDAGRRRVILTDREIPYDTLVYALGSAATAPGHNVATRPAALRLRERLGELRAGETVLVVGGGLTAIELSTEIAESRPDLHVAIAARAGVGDWLGDKARRHLGRVFDRLGITVHEHTTVTGDGEPIPASVTVWATGFTTHPIASASELTVSPTGRLVVDGSMRSVSHPEVYAVGDAVFAEGPDGRPLRMACATAIPTAWQAADAIAARLTGRRVPKGFPIRYYGQCVSLGRRDGVLQFATADGRSVAAAVTGPRAARIKEFISSGTGWSLTRPTVLMPVRRRQIRSAPGAPGGTTGRTGETAGSRR
ncbi:NAD(P)/FAD-dependent oxidoreductase [Paractinoplanes maris]|uniref:NAD(P)/FAD-dependent oxidoreductase n=1 Tax=Paractinoplanes maris TaxID=1734446 RepID=UPI0020202020|nr:FAD-dependent oxidoreductase [Actinoplanes maris]